ncbi:MAG: hypothetical protein SGI88_15125 [Candidatus Hydrogenedentes bacterium]|nr:hypothetical protein [Candidatus Hydrogenedentota bacterium]
MIVQRAAYAIAWGVLALCVVLFVAGLVRNPVKAKRQQFDQRIAEASPEELNLDFNAGAEFEQWQQNVSARPKLWQPLVPPPAVVAPPPALLQMLAGVEPTRNTMGSGDTIRVQIRVDGKKEWFSKGQSIKGCTLQEITDTEVLFTVVQQGQTHGIRLPRK